MRGRVRIIGTGIPILVLLLAALALSACAVTPTPSPTDTPTPSPTPTPTVESVESFADRLVLAFINREYDALQAMMGDPFAVGFWLSEGVEWTPAEAVAQLQANYLGPATAVAFDTSTDLTALLGMDPLGMWGPDVNAVRALYVKGLGADGRTEAILILALRPDGSPYWHGMLVAREGFHLPEGPTETPTPLPATPTPAPTATPTPVAGVTPTPERVTFAPGATSATLTGEVSWPERKEYILRALAGQTMTVEITSPDGLANFAILGVDDGVPYKRLVNEDRSFSFELPATQDYLITVARPEGSSTYTLTITITSPAAEAERIVFGPGEISARRSGVLEAAGGYKEFVLTAGAGQIMEVIASGDPVPVDLAITSPSGVRWLGEPFGYDGAMSIKTILLPESGDYRITLSTPLAAPASNYDLTVSVVTPAQPGAPPERITFAPGATSASRRGGLLPGIEKQYVLGAAAGQVMRVRTTALRVPVNFTIVTPGGATFTGELQGSEAYIFERTITLPENGDYVVNVSTPADAEPTLYDILFEITERVGMIPTPTPERVEFAPGATSATLTGEVAWPEQKVYVLRALAGQTMTVEITSPDGLANFAIVGEDGIPIKRLVNEDRTFSFELPATQDYFVTVARPEGSSTYTLTITIE